MPPAKRSLPPEQNARTAVLLKLLEKPVDDVHNIPILLREVATVAIVLSNELTSVHRAVRGYNGDSGLIGRQDLLQNHVEKLESDLKEFIQESREVRWEREAREKAAHQKPDTFQRLLNWFAGKVLPGLVQTLIILLVGGAVALWWDYKTRTGTP